MRKRMRKRTEEEEESKAEKLCLRYYYLSPFSWVFAFSPPDPRKRLAGAGSIDIGACLPMITHVIGAGALFCAGEADRFSWGTGGSFWLFFFFFLSYRGREGKGRDGMGWNGEVQCISSVASLRPDKRRGAVIGERSGCLTVLVVPRYLTLPEAVILHPSKSFVECLPGDGGWCVVRDGRLAG
jgi:hypothetical protein